MYSSRSGSENPSPSIIEAAIPKGAVLSDSGRLCFPRSLMEDLIDGCSKEFTHYAPNPDNDIQIGGDRVHFRTCGEAVNIFDYGTREARPSKLVDLYDTARLADRLPNIHAFCQTVVATEHSDDAFVHDINALYAQLAGTQKALAMSTATPEHIDHFITLLDLFLGREGAFLERPCFNFGGCPIVSPLRFGADNAEVLVKCARLGIPYDIAVASQPLTGRPDDLAAVGGQAGEAVHLQGRCGEAVQRTVIEAQGVEIESGLRLTGVEVGGEQQVAIIGGEAVRLVEAHRLADPVGLHLADPGQASADGESADAQDPPSPGAASRLYAFAPHQPVPFVRETRREDMAAALSAVGDLDEGFAADGDRPQVIAPVGAGCPAERDRLSGLLVGLLDHEHEVAPRWVPGGIS